MKLATLLDSGLEWSNPDRGGEHPGVVINDIANRPRPQARVITVANEKGGVGKSTLAFHLCVALADAGYEVLGVDLDRRQQSLSRALANRSATANRLRVKLPQPRHVVLHHQTGAMLAQEIARLGAACDYVVIDAAGTDCGIVRRAVAMANLLISPVTSSFVDLDLLGRLHPLTRAYRGPGCFAEMVLDLRAARRAAGLAPLEWAVLRNRRRRDNSHDQNRVEAALQELAGQLDFRLGEGLSERVIYRELFLLGLTHLDLGRIPDLARSHSVAVSEVRQLLDLVCPATLAACAA